MTEKQPHEAPPAAHIDVLGYRPTHLSYSTISSFRMCGAKFYFGKIAGLEERPGLAAIAGNAVHRVTEDLDRLVFAQGWDALEPTLEETPPF